MQFNHTNMKKILLPLIAVSILSACTNVPKADKASTTEKQAVAAADGVVISTDSNSTLTWTGTKPTGTHTGLFKLKEGNVVVKDNNLTGGSFVIDINSLSNLDLPESDKPKLEGHLKSPDFFDVEKYPTAKFEITSVEPFKPGASEDVVMKDATHTIKGNLTLKDSTKNIAFPAKIEIAAGKVTAVADFNIDRTAWGMNYKGPNNPADWVIRKAVNLKLNISASKK